jgi:hypothetical protein
MTYGFTGTPDDSMTALFDNLDHSRQGGPSAHAYFRYALLCLVSLHDRVDVVGPVDPERLRRFRRESGEALVSFSRDIVAYVTDTTYLAEEASDDELYELCIRRSEIQFLVDDYEGTAVAALVNLSEVAQLDGDLRRVGEEQGPLPEPFVPKGLPASHWWWHQPRAAGST